MVPPPAGGILSPVRAAGPILNAGKHAKKAPFYRIVVADSRYPRDGRFIEEIGTYNPLTTPAELKVDAERAQAWIKTGAQPTDTVRSLLKKAGAL